jgi:hypothetical protein
MEIIMNSGSEGRSFRASQLSSSILPGLELLNPNLVFGTAWFWTLPEVHEVQKEIDALSEEFRRYIGLNERLASVSDLKSAIEATRLELRRAGLHGVSGTEGQ